nr:probable LRR receptor-like serine/threonine-protein kinase At1g06840 isoform X2 [Tanacetum cinerariifolium]
MKPVSHGKIIVREAKLANQAGTMFSIIDNRMGSYPSECIERFVSLAFWCCKDKPEKRPSMLDVVRELKHILEKMPETCTELFRACVKMSVYEFISRRTLRDWLYAGSGDSSSFRLRLHVALDSAKGILYLHTEASPPIFHDDIKTSNILIDSKLIPKLLILDSQGLHHYWMTKESYLTMYPLLLEEHPLCSKPSRSIKPLKTPLISSSPSPSLKVFVTEFDGSKDPNAIIPPISNEWTEALVKFQTTNSFLANITDGLNLRTTISTKTKTINRRSKVIAVSDQLKNDLERLPDHKEFDGMPVEEFAAAYARGYGWKPGKEVPSWISRNKHHPFNKVLPYTNQTGLGFVEEKKLNAAAAAKEIMVSRRKRSWEEEEKFWCCGSGSGDSSSFKMRLHVALDSAKGILYLHTEANPPIFHHEIKTSNILIDSKLTSKIADSGLSMLAPLLDD